MKCHPFPLPPYLSGSNGLKLTNLEDYDLGQSWNSSLIPRPLSPDTKIKIVQAMRLQVSSTYCHGAEVVSS